QLFPHQMDLQHHVPVGEDAPVLDGLDHRRSRHPRETIRIERVLVPEDLRLVVLPVRLVRDDGNTFSDVRTQAATMICMMMRVDHVLDWVAGLEPSRRLYLS